MKTQPYIFNTLSLSNNNPLEEIGNQFLSNAIHGIVIEGFLSLNEISQILNRIQKLTENELTIINKGFKSYPKSFAQLTQGLMDKSIDEKVFFKDSSFFRENFEKEFGVDIEKKMRELFGQLFPNKTLDVPTDKNGYGSFLPFNFRELLPQFGELKVHCENLFFNEFPLFFELLNHQVIRKNDFSFFIVLQKPEQGGELCLFDELWNENNEGFLEIDDTNNYSEQIELKRNITYQIAPPAGSIVVFSGGDIWHKVSKIDGQKSRITLGGFVSSGIEKKRIFMWA